MPESLAIRRSISWAGNTAAGATAFAAIVPPEPIGLYTADAALTRFYVGNAPNQLSPPSRTHITGFTYQTGANSHKITLLRPKGWTTAASAAAKNTGTLNLTDDPGLYATAGRYRFRGDGVLPCTVNNGIATNDFFAYQLADGTWLFSKGTVSTLAVTITTLPNAGGGILAGAVVFWFGAPGDIDPATGIADPSIQTLAAVEKTYSDAVSFWESLQHGVPLIMYSDNATAQGWLSNISGYYAAY